MKKLNLLISVFAVVFGFAVQAAPFKPSEGRNGPSENLLHKSNAFYGDSRKDLNSNQAPWSAIGRLSTPTGSACSATLVGADLILTAAHCILNKESKFVTGKYLFHAGYRNGRYLAVSEISFAWWGNREGNRSENDWAILRLRTRIGDKVGWMGVRNTTTQGLLDLTEVMYHASYSMDWKGMEYPFWQRDCKFHQEAYGQDAGLHNCSNSRGASGGAIFVWDENRKEHYIVAINVAEYREGKDQSLKDIPFSIKYANLAIPSARFFQTLKNLLN